MHTLDLLDSLTKDVELNENVTDTIMASIKKTEKVLLLAVPSDIYSKVEQLGTDAINAFVEKQLEKWNDNTLVDPYIVLTKEDALEEHLDNINDYPDANEYYKKFHGGYLNENGDVVSVINENGFYSSHNIRHSGITFQDVMNMILEEKFSFNYIVHNGILYNKDSATIFDEISTVDSDSVVIVVNCYD